MATSGDKMLTLFEELKGSDASPELVQVHLVFVCLCKLLFVCLSVDLLLKGFVQFMLLSIQGFEDAFSFQKII